MNHHVLPLGAYEANCTILWNASNDQSPKSEVQSPPTPCWIVDPGAEPEVLTAFLAERNLAPALVAFTHAHFDHVGATAALLAAWPDLVVHLGPGDVPFLGDARNCWPPDYPLQRAPAAARLAPDLVDGFVLSAAGLSARVIATPGHTPGGVSLWFEDAALLLAGDTLFCGSAGRTDFPGGDARALAASLARLAALPPETHVVCGHGPDTTIARERAANPFLPR